VIGEDVKRGRPGRGAEFQKDFAIKPTGREKEEGKGIWGKKKKRLRLKKQAGVTNSFKKES